MRLRNAIKSRNSHKQLSKWKRQTSFKHNLLISLIQNTLIINLFQTCIFSKVKLHSNLHWILIWAQETRTEIFFLNEKIASFHEKETRERDNLRIFIWIVEMFMKFDFSVEVWALIWGRFTGKMGDKCGVEVNWSKEIEL